MNDDPAAKHRLLAVWPFDATRRVTFALGGTRSHWRFEQPAPEGLRVFVVKSTVVVQLPNRLTPHHLEGILTLAPSFDLLTFWSKAHPFSKPIRTWLRTQCRPLLRASSLFHGPGSAYRCRSKTVQETRQRPNR